MQQLPQPPIMLITDRLQAKTAISNVVLAALRGGCRWVLLREPDLESAVQKNAEDTRLKKLAREIQRCCDLHKAYFFVSRNAPLAKYLHAHGLHMQSGADLASARSTLGAEALIGQSCHNAEEAAAAAVAGANTITLSPIFKTESKPDTRTPLGLETLKTICKNSAIPVLALGGMTPERARQCKEAGAAGIAVMGDMMRAENPEARMRDYVAVFE